VIGYTWIELDVVVNCLLDSTLKMKVILGDGGDDCDGTPYVPKACNVPNLLINYDAVEIV